MFIVWLIAIVGIIFGIIVEITEDRTLGGIFLLYVIFVFVCLTLFSGVVAFQYQFGG